MFAAIMLLWQKYGSKVAYLQGPRAFRELRLGALQRPIWQEEINILLLFLLPLLLSESPKQLSAFLAKVLPTRSSEAV